MAKNQRRAIILEYLKTHPCVDCGEADPRVLEFDHRDGGNKTAAVSLMLSQMVALPTFRSEIRKCDVRCANCHRRRTSRQYAWYKESV